MDQVLNQSENEQEVEPGATTPAHLRASATPARFGIVGVAIRFLIAIAIVVAVIFVAQSMVSSRPDPVQRGAFERSYTVSVVAAEPVDFTVQLRGFGEIVAAVSLNIKSQVAATIIYVSPNLRTGGTVQLGEVLLRVDPFDYALALANARDDLTDADLALQEAREQVDIQTLNVDFAGRQLAVATSDLERAQTLLDRGTLTNQELEARELVVSQREQSLRQAQSTLTLQNAAAQRREHAIVRASRAVEQSVRTLAATTVYAPFNAVIISSNVALGAVIGPNDTVAAVFDADALEARFSVSEQDYGQLASLSLIDRPMRAIWDIEPEPMVLEGTISRVGAQVDPTLGGVELFAELNDAAGTIIRPGTFVSIELPGATFEDVLVIPETALYEDDHFYILVDGKMQRVPAVVRFRDGENVILDADVPDQARIIVTRLAQAGEGLRVRLEGEEQTPPSGGRPGRPQADTPDGGPRDGPRGAPQGGPQPGGG